MANPEHVEIIKKGVRAWNKWRTEYSQVSPDLSGTSLRDSELTLVNLFQADLSGANLETANLRRADLCESKLIRAALPGANLRRANLTKADLSSTDLSGTNLGRSNLAEANLRGATLGFTTFVFTDLSSAKGLETCRHLGPSALDYFTLMKSGNLPDEFLTGCGLSDTFVTYLKSLTTTPIDFYSCFISYSTKDQEFADRLYNDLQGNGVRCWYAPEDLKIGERFRQRIDESIKVYDKLMIILSEHSFESDWVESEVESALEKEQMNKATVLFPIRLDHAIMDTSQAWAADIRRKRHIGDFSNWKDHDAYKKAFDRLLRDLKGSETKKD